MQDLDIKDLLGLFAPRMINKKKSFFRKDIPALVPSSEQNKFVKKYKNNVSYKNGVYMVSEDEGDVVSVPSYNYFVLYEKPYVEESQRIIKNLNYFFEGFETYGELKSRIQDETFDTGLFTVYIKDYLGYREVQYNVFYDEENDRWTDFYIPCLGEVFDVKIIANNDETIKSTPEIITGVFFSQEDVENFINETMVFDQMRLHEPFEITGVYSYEGIMNEFKVECNDFESCFESLPVVKKVEPSSIIQKD